MRRVFLNLLYVLVAVTLVACSDDAGNTGQESVEPDHIGDTGTYDADGYDGDAPILTPGEPDTGPDSDLSADADARPDIDDETPPEECIPSITECTETVCGLIDDGCGRVVECQPCPCILGAASPASCGACDLGVRRCGEDETGFGFCDEPQIPGLSADTEPGACATKLIFADAEAPPGGDGSRESPYSTYAHALAAADAGQTIILGGSNAFTEPLSVKNGVSVLGGYSAAPAFLHDASIKTKFQVAPPADADVFGLKAQDIDESTLLAQISISTGDASTEYSNYGAYIRDAVQLTLRAVDIRAGKGGDGTAGAPGDSGADGGPGQHAFDAGMQSAFDRDLVLYKYLGTTTGGTNPACPAANGGRGGSGKYSMGSYGYFDSEDGESTAGAEGGKAGGLIPIHMSVYAFNPFTGGDGEDAESPTDIPHGSGGLSGGQVAGDLWVPQGRGLDGQPGDHGFGGGGGGGASTPADIKAAPPGGGGGAGGCGGQPGTGGKPGGGSFGLFLVRSNLMIEDSSFQASPGGQGGAGGSGGPGGMGGSGGRSSLRGLMINSTGVYQYVDTIASSGNGGRGADGGAGGSGGGGAGGVSYGAYCTDSHVQSLSQVVFTAGTAAFGGQSTGHQGGAGLSKDSEGCD